MQKSRAGTDIGILRGMYYVRCISERRKRKTRSGKIAG